MKKEQSYKNFCLDTLVFSFSMCNALWTMDYEQCRHIYIEWSGACGLALVDMLGMRQLRSSGLR